MSPETLFTPKNRPEMPARVNPKAQHQARFLAAYAKCGCIVQAAQCARIDRTTHYVWMRCDPTYLVRFKATQEIAADELEAEARERAIEGTLVPVLIEDNPFVSMGRFSSNRNILMRY